MKLFGLNTDPKDEKAPRFKYLTHLAAEKTSKPATKSSPKPKKAAKKPTKKRR